MQIRLGYELIYDCPQPKPMLLKLNVHYTRISDMVVPDHLVTSPDPDPGLPRRLRQLVQPDRGADRANSAICERDRQRRGQPDVVADREPPSCSDLKMPRFCRSTRSSGRSSNCATRRFSIRRPRDPGRELICCPRKSHRIDHGKTLHYPNWFHYHDCKKILAMNERFSEYHRPL
jgi:hypothetical protein